jgi:hypothetical protein
MCCEKLRKHSPLLQLLYPTRSANCRLTADATTTKEAVSDVATSSKLEHGVQTVLECQQAGASAGDRESLPAESRTTTNIDPNSS